MIPLPRPAGAAALLLLALASPALAQQPAPGATPAAPAQPADPAAAPDKPAAEAEPEEEPEEAPTAQPGKAPKPAPAATPPAAEAAPTTAGAPQASSIALADAPIAKAPLAQGWRGRVRAQLGPFRIEPSFLVQTQISPYVGEDSFFQAGDIAERPGFRLRRARIGIGGGLNDEVRFALSTQISGADDSGTLLLHEAWGAYTALRYLQVYAGAWDVPFSRSALTGSDATALIERPFAVRAIAPFKQVGLQLRGEFGERAFTYQAGVFNGLQRSDQFYRGHNESFAPLGNRFEGLAVAGRVATEPLGPLGGLIHDFEHSPFRFGAGADFFYSASGARTLMGASGDVLVHVRGLHVLAEVLWLRAAPQSVPSQPITQVTSIPSLGIVGEAGYMIVPRRFGLSARVEWIDPNPDVDNEADNFIFTGGASFHAIEDLLRAQLEYTHREELYGLVLANDSVTLQLQLSL